MASASARDEVLEKLGVGPHLVQDYLTMVGDAADNIKAAKGIGPKNAAAILGFYGSLDATYEAIDAGSASRLKPAQLASPRRTASTRLEARPGVGVKCEIDVPLDIGAVLKPRVPKVVETFMDRDDTEMETKHSQRKPTPQEAMAGDEMEN